MSNDFVAMETKICPACGVEHSHNTGILIHKNMREIKEDQTCTGMGYCEEHQKQIDDGYMFLLEVSNPMVDSHTRMAPEEANLTGVVISIKKHFMQELIGKEIPEEENMAYVDTDFIEVLKNLKTEDTLH